MARDGNSSSRVFASECFQSGMFRRSVPSSEENSVVECERNGYEAHGDGAGGSNPSFLHAGLAS
jgi:hypothetical protein